MADIARIHICPLMGRCDGIHCPFKYDFIKNVFEIKDKRLTRAIIKELESRMGGFKEEDEKISYIG